MSTWPEPENIMIPEGHYVFTLREDPAFETWAYTDKKGREREGNKILLEVVGVNDAGEFDAHDQIPVWDKRYADLCAALFVEHGKDIRMAGAEFEADIKYEPDRKDARKSWPRIINITAHGGEPEFPEGTKTNGDGSEIPF